MEDYQNFSYWFSDTIVDPKGNTVSDINRGIRRLFTDLVESMNHPDTTENTTFIINEIMNGQPDSAAFLKYNNHNLWWFLSLSNNLENPIEDFKNYKVFFAFERGVLDNFAEKELEDASNNYNESKIGKIVELN